MKTMNLVLQGPQADPARLEQIAALAEPARVVRLHERALRCEAVAFSPALKEAVDTAALAAQADASFIEAGQTTTAG